MNPFSIGFVQDFIAQNQFHPTGDSFLDTRYEHHYQKYGHHWKYYRFFFELSRLLKPSLTVELGGWQGTAASHFAAGWPLGDVITIDHLSDPGDELNLALMQAAEKVYPNLVHLHGWTWDVVDMVKALGKPIDILFIDSWHDYEHAMRDWKDYSPLLADKALIICDDIIPGYGAVISGMMDFWDELPGEKYLDEDNLHPGSNIGFIEYVKTS